MKNVLDKIIKFPIYFLVFLVPLFFLPFSFEAYEFNKQYLIFFLVSLSFLAWLARMIFVDKEIRFRRTPLDIPILLFLFFAILSTVFSVDKNSSLFGFYGRFSNGLILLLSFGFLYFLITNNISEKQQVDRLVKIFLWSVCLVILISYLSIFRVWQKIPIFSALIFPRTFNPVSGSLEGLTLFLSIIIVLLVALITSSKWNFRFLGDWILLIASLGLMVIIDFNPAWLVLATTMGLFLIFSLATRIFSKNVNRLLLSILLIFLAVAFIFIDTFRFQFPIFQLPREQILGQKISWKIALGSVRENIKSGFLGSGIGTFHYEFSKYKPVEFNQNLWWQIRFDRAGSHIAEILGTIGFLGVLSYLFLIGLFFLASWFLPQKVDFLPLMIAFLASFIGQFVYYQNTTLAFTFWLFLGLSVVSWQKPISERVFSFKDFPELSLVFSTILILLSLGVLVSYYFGIRFYLADVNYAKSQLVLGEERTKLLEKAIMLNPNGYTYWIVLARSFWFQIREETGKPLAEQDAVKIQNWVSKAIDTAKTCTHGITDAQGKLISPPLAPNSVVAWETLGMIYRDIQLLAAGAIDWAIKSFQRAIELEPKNPVLYTELGKLYLASDLKKAGENFAKAKELKSDYIDAQIQEALIYERENDLDKAVAKMEELVVNYPLNVEARFQLGRLYFNKDRIDEAITQFEQVIQLIPNHSNSLYSLGLAYTRKGQKDKAISAFEKVLELNPGNQDVIQKLEQLKR